MLSQEIQLALKEATKMANDNKNGYVTLEYLLLAMCRDKSTIELLSFCEANISELKESLGAFINDNIVKGSLDENKAHPTIALKRVLQRATDITKSLMPSEAESGQLDAVLGNIVIRTMLEEEDSNAVYLMNRQGVYREMTNEYITSVYNHQLGSYNGGTSSDVSTKALTATLTTNELANNLLGTFAINVNQQVLREGGDPLIGRADELTRIIQVLARQRKNNPLLIGESGVGKTAIVRGLALAIEEGEVPKSILNCEIYSLDVTALLAGTRYRGDFEKRVKAIIGQLEKKKDAILFIDDIHTLIGAGSVSSETMDASSLFKPAIMSGFLRCIGATNHEHFRTIANRDFTHNFQKVDIPQMSFNQIYRVLEAIRPRLEKFHSVSYTPDSLRSAISLSDRYIGERHQPDKAIDVLDEAGAFQKVERESDFVVGEGYGAGGIGYLGDNLAGSHGFLSRLDFKSINSKFNSSGKNVAAKADNKQPVTMLRIEAKEIQETIAKMTGLPLENLKDDTQYQLKRLETELSKSVFGQGPAIKQLVSSIKLARVGLNQPNRPLGCYMLAGPTGVGKTEVCKQLAKYSGINLIRYDMSEYSESHTIARLVGAPPGYVGFDTGSQLTSEVMKAPHSIVLFDEMEKAHPNIYNLLLQIMDYGYLTDNTGHKCDFRNTIIIVTTNAGAADMHRRSSGFAEGKKYDNSQAIMSTFSPEFRNRLDAIIQFDELNLAVMEDIATKFMEEIQGQIVEKNVTLDIDATARKWLAKKGYDPLMGARPLIRLIKEQIKMPLADMMLFGDLAKQGGTIKVSANKKQITLSSVSS